MTSLTITPDLAKKKMKVDGVIAAGESVAVSIPGFVSEEHSPANTRLRVIFGSETIAMFPPPVRPGETREEWTIGEDGSYSCELNLFTIQAELATRCGSAHCLFILDDVDAKQLYATKEHDVGQWVKRRGTDIPLDLHGYAHFVSDVREELDGFRSDIEQYKSDLSAAWETYKADFNAAYAAFTAQVQSQISSKADASDLASHVNDKDNPHEVTIAQIPGLRTDLDTIDARITAEASARISSENGIRDSVIAETQRAGTKEAQLAGAIVGENQRAMAAEAELGNRIDDAVHVLRGKTYQRPTTARGWYDLLADVISVLGGNIATAGIVPGTNPEEITLTAEDGTVRSISVTKVDGEYTTIVR